MTDFIKRLSAVLTLDDALRFVRGRIRVLKSEDLARAGRGKNPSLVAGTGYRVQRVKRESRGKNPRGREAAAPVPEEEKRAIQGGRRQALRCDPPLPLFPHLPLPAIRQVLSSPSPAQQPEKD